MLLDSSILDLAKMMETGKTSAEEVAKEALTTHKTNEPKLHNFLHVVDDEGVLSQAKQADQTKEQAKSALHGVPFGLKDCYVTKDIPTTAGSKILDDFIPPYSATVYEKLLAAGAILIGKQSLDAWGHGGSNENTDFTVPLNPWDTDRTTGGSSGGSAGSVAAREVMFSIGEDTGGSIRNPVSMCGISGLKVTYGRVSRFGAIAYASSLDTVGPMAKHVSDLAVILKEIAGADVKDASSSHVQVDDYLTELTANLKGKVIGLPKQFFAKETDPEVIAAVQTAVAVFKQLGITVKEVTIPILEQSIPIYYMLAASETSSNLARYDGIRYGKDRSLFTQENGRRILLGTYALSAGYADKLYKKAQMARTELIAEFDRVLSECDVLLGPVLPMLPPKSGELISNPLQNMLADLFTVCANITGVPALALPVGFSKSGLPIGMQIIGKKFHEGEILAFGHQYQQQTDWHMRKPL